MNSSNTKGDEMSLSLISKFCDTKLKELSGGVQSHSESDENSEGNSWFSAVFNESSLYKPKKREHSYGSRIARDKEHDINCSDFGDPNAQQLRIERKIPLSKHIKGFKIVDFTSDEHNGEDNEVLKCSLDSDIQSANTFVKERLDSYLPVLKRNVQNSAWTHLDTFPSLEILMPSGGTNVRKENGPEYTHNTLHYAYKWDREQALLIASTPDLFVFYGVISKPNSINQPRLGKLFAHAGVASLPMQNVCLMQKRLFLQDGTGRIELKDSLNKLQFKNVVSGIPVAIIGKVVEARLNIEDVIFATPCSPEWPLPREDGIEMVFVSGLFLGSEDTSNLALDLLQDYLLGLVGSAHEQENIIAPRVRLFLVGNFISKTAIGDKSLTSNLNRCTSVCTKNMEKLDNFLEPLVRLMEVFLIPGENDLTTSAVPQEAIHPKLLPRSAEYCSLKRLTNPAKIQVSVSKSGTSPKVDTFDDCSILVDSSFAELLQGQVDFIDMVLLSGKNVKQTMQYCDISCPMEMGRNLLKWGHLLPTYCDTSLALGENLLTLKGASPHLVVIGNLSEFKVVNFNETKIIGVPSFQKTKTAVILTKNFDVTPISFKFL